MKDREAEYRAAVATLTELLSRILTDALGQVAEGLPGCGFFLLITDQAERVGCGSNMPPPQVARLLREAIDVIEKPKDRADA